MNNSKTLLETIIQACDEKHAQDIVVLDMSEISLVADYFVICHANNERQVQAIAREIKDTIDINKMEGFEDSRWVVIDADGVLVHVFHKEERMYYNLERLWGDATRVSVEQGIDKQ
ncbi:ribosome silencing factor [Ornithinibacillus sp. 4-3]|uniref:Ribosomal silencing factor RsfS n=1 Tax=Ornithinibacillus sp. 4-3 TaxID=3231488 RepID=A0AB39HMZ4_9BACI